MHNKQAEGEDGIKILDKSDSTILLTFDLVNRWQIDDVVKWLSNQGTVTSTAAKCFELEGIDGSVLLKLTESDLHDLRYRCGYELRYGEIKKLWQIIYNLQSLLSKTKEHREHHGYNSYSSSSACNCYCSNNRTTTALAQYYHGHYENCPIHDWDCWINDTSSASDGYAKNVEQEYSKTIISLAYSFIVTWITSFVMVIVHERVPDMQRYPPLPDIFLDNVPHIPWAFDMCEITGTVLFFIWVTVCIYHKYRMVLLRRFFALAGTVFLLRCVTMLITSLSVPGTHLECNKRDYAVDDELNFSEALYLRITRAYVIWSGFGMSIQGVRTCGDYMFSGHTCTLTLLNFFITEYTPRSLYFLHTLTWLLNMFGIFFILAAHEHYSIDVFVAFYITSRLFLYYHTLANNQALMQRDSTRTRIWFPMFSYFESSINGIVPNEYDNFQDLCENLLSVVIEIKDIVMLTANRVWLEAPSLPLTTSSGRFLPSQESLAKLRSTAASKAMANLILLKNMSSISTGNDERIKTVANSNSAISKKSITTSTLTDTNIRSGNSEVNTFKKNDEIKKPLKKSVNVRADSRVTAFTQTVTTTASIAKKTTATISTSTSTTTLLNNKNDNHLDNSIITNEMPVKNLWQRYETNGKD